jgi:hypothetical protein
LPNRDEAETLRVTCFPGAGRTSDTNKGVRKELCTGYKGVMGRLSESYRGVISQLYRSYTPVIRELWGSYVLA